MRKLLIIAGGVLAGAAIGTALVLLLTPASGDQIRTDLRSRVGQAKEAGSTAAQRKRQDLEAEWTALTGLKLPEPTKR